MFGKFKKGAAMSKRLSIRLSLRTYLSAMTFRQKLFLFSLLMSMIPALVLGLFSSYYTARSIQYEVDQNHGVILQQLEGQVDSYLRNLDEVSLALANSQIIQKSLQTGIAMENPRVALDMIDIILKSTVTSQIDFTVSLYYKNFNLIYSSKLGLIRDLNYPYNEIISYIQLHYNGLDIIPPNTYPNMREMMLIRSVPLNSPNPDGYLILHLDIDQIKQLIERLNLGVNRKVVIVNERGEVIASRAFGDLGSQLLPTAALYEYWVNPGLLVGSLGIDGVDYHVSSLRSTLNNWTYIALVPSSELTAKSRSIRNVMWLVMAGSLLIWTIVAGIGSRRLYFPIQRIVSKFESQDKVPADGLLAIDKFMDHMLARNEHLQTQLNKQTPQLREFMLQRLLHGDLNNGDVVQMMEDHGSSLQGSWFYVLAIEMDDLVSFRQRYIENDRFLILYGLRNIIEELAKGLPSVTVVAPKPGQVVLIIGVTEPSDTGRQRINQLCEDIRENVWRYLHFTVSAAISSLQNEYAGIGEAYQESIGLLKYRWVDGIDHTFAADQMEPSIQQSGRILVTQNNAIVNSMTEGQVEKAKQQLADMIDAVPRALQNPQSICGLLAMLLGEIDHRLHELGYRQVQDMFEYDLLDYMHGLPSLLDVRVWMADTVFMTIHEQLKSQTISRPQKLIAQVQQYIREHYETDLSLQILADKFQLSTGTLSRMFKKESGVNYLDFIIQVRMDKAKEWLVHTDMPIKEMTDRLRYTTVHNFTRIFKQQSGLPPGNYRTKHRESLDV
jgi:two-component system response regulator YesN